MILVVLFGTYVVTALLYIFIKAQMEQEIQVKIIIFEKLPTWLIITLKGIPALLLTLLVSNIYMNDVKQTQLAVVAAGFFCCLIGDIAITQKLELGIVFFSFAHLMFTSIFILESIPHYTSLDTLGLMWRLALICLILILIVTYINFFIKYLVTGEPGLDKLKLPVIFYSILLSGTFLSSCGYFLVSSNILSIVLPVGALLFLISDSIIAVREFHHSLSYGTIKVMITYYLAILFLSLGFLIV